MTNWFEVWLQRSHDYVCVADADLGLVRASPSFLEAHSIMIPRSMVSFLGSDDVRRLKAAIARALEDEESAELETSGLPGQDLHIQWSITPLSNGLCLLVGRDVTASCLEKKDLRKKAYYCGLTQLPNRALLMDRIKQGLALAKRDQRRSALVFVDLNKFKAVNDQFGHDVGDGLLIQVGERLNARVRQTDTVARLSGDEFVVFVPTLPDDDHEDLINRLMEAFQRPFTIGNHTVQVGASMGSAIYPDDNDDWERLLKRADERMYAMKRGEQ